MLKKSILFLLTSSLVLVACGNKDKESQTEDVKLEESKVASESTEEVWEEAETMKDDTESSEGEESEETQAYIRDTAILEENFQSYLGENGIDSSRVSFVYQNLSDDMRYEHNGDQIFLAGSVSKVPIVMYLFDEAYRGNIDLDQYLTVGENHMEGGTGVIYYQSGPGASYSLYELADLMISASDNTATNMMYGYLGAYSGDYLLNTLANVYGISSYNGNYMTANEAMMVLERIYYNEKNNPLYDDLIGFMEDQIYNDYFTAYIEADKIAHKTGDFDGYFNDIGYIEDRDSPYAFAIFTDNLDYPIAVLNDLGLIVHGWHTGQDIR